jgi:hypothetical protein
MNSLQAGITAAREGRQNDARALLQQGLQADPRSEQGWLWMSTVVETDPERRICLERVLTINPHNQTALAALERLDTSASAQDAPGLQPTPGRDVEPRRETSEDRVSRPPSPHSLPTVGVSPVVPSPRPIERLDPGPAPVDDLAQLRAAQFKPPDTADKASPETDAFMALVLIGGLSITAIAGALMLGVLWIIGWPP